MAMSLPRRTNGSDLLAQLSGAGSGGGSPMPTGASTEDLSNQQLQGLDTQSPAGLAGGGAPDDAMIQQMQAALQNPQTPPQERQMILMQLAMAAQRRLGAGQSGPAA